MNMIHLWVRLDSPQKPCIIGFIETDIAGVPTRFRPAFNAAET